MDGEYRTAGVDYRCLSDAGTEIDSEWDKIEYEFRPIQPLSKDEMKILSEEIESKYYEGRKPEEMSSERELEDGVEKEEGLNCTDNKSETAGSRKSRVQGS